MKRYPLVTLFLLIAWVSVSAHEYMFRHLEMKDGLSNNQVNAIYKDSEGFMWFGTAFGLNRYDGYGIKVYLNEPGDATSLPDNYISDIQEAADGCLWIRTDRGYALYNPATDTFSRDIETWMWNVGITGVPACVYIDSNKFYWIYLAKSGELYRYIPGEEAAVLVRDLSEALEGVENVSFAECQKELLLADDRGVLYALNRFELSLKWVDRKLSDVLDTDRHHSVSLYVDRSQRLWACSTVALGRYDLSRRTWEILRRCTDPSDVWRQVIEDKDGRIWLGKDQDGIEVLDRTGASVCLISKPESERSLSNNTITAFYEDEAGTMWVGTYKGGVSYYNESMFKFELADCGDVHCVEDGGDGIVWLGTNGAGLIRWDRRSDEKQFFTHIPGDSRSISSDVIVSLLRDRRGRLWAGTYYGGLNCYDGHRFVNYKPKPGQAGSLADTDVWALAEDAAGYIWIGTLNHGLQCLNPQTGVFTSYTSDNSGLTSDCVVSLCIRKDGSLLIGTVGGVFVMDLENHEITRLTGKRSGKPYFAYDFVMQVCEDNKQRLWVATRAGLNVYDVEHDTLYAVPLDEKLLRQPVSSLVEDNRQEMWASVGGKLVNIVTQEEPKTGKLTFVCHTYSDKDGLQSGDFNQRALKCLYTGEIVAGGLYGVNYFRPGNIRYNKAAPRVMFAGLQLFNEEVETGVPIEGRVILPETLNRLREVVLDYEQNVFTVFLASDNYVLPEKTRYYYKMEGFNEDWLVERENLHRVTYTNLAPGTYLLRVKAANSDGVCGEESCLKVVIRPPFWLSPWAWGMYVLLLLGILLLAYYGVKRHERNKYHMRQIEEDARRNEELTQMKFRFFTNVSHELRTPLTLIISPLENLIAHTHDEPTAGKLKMIYRNAQRLLHLVNQLLDFRKNEMAGSHLSLSEGEVVSFVRNICNSFLMLSEKNEIQLTFFSAIESLNMAFDADKLGKIVMNLLSNAFKFTPEGGRVTVSLDLLATPAEMLELQVADTGIGIQDADKEHIFERFYQAEHSGEVPPSTGSGIGLSLVRDFVSLHEGTVHVSDNPGGGSIFVVTIPVKHVTVAATPLQEQKEIETKDASESIPSESGGKKKPLILVVDDSRDFVDFMKDALSLYFSVKTAANGQEALDMLGRCRPDLILCDLMMPVMDGKELCRRVKAEKQTAGIPFVLLTARQSVEMKVESLTIGADDYVTKPFNLEVLILRMRKLIDWSRKGKPRAHIEPEPAEIVITSVDEKLVADAIAYVEANISRSDLSVEELSRELGMSRAHLYKKMLQITGKTPIEFIRIIRLKRAAQLLRESQRNVSEIAFQLGFNNPKYFSRYFKEEFGVLPSVYQEREGK